ncbi:MAG: hypothetical protein ACTS5I_10145, partial [Rhodanobacter sp.]
MSAIIPDRPGYDRYAAHGINEFLPIQLLLAGRSCGGFRLAGQEYGYLLSYHRLSHRYRVVADQVARTDSKTEMDPPTGSAVFLGQRDARHD